MKQSEHYVVEGASRLDMYLTNKFPLYTRNQWQDRIKQGLVEVNSGSAKPSQSVQEGSLITLLENKAEKILPTPITTTLPIIYEDDAVMVINKPPNMVVYQPLDKQGPSVRSILAHYIQGQDKRDGIVHRLDRDTSGVMIVAKTPSAESFLKQQFKKRQVEKKYTVLVEGHMSEDAARVELPIARMVGQYQKMKISPNGKLGILEYVVDRRFAANDLLAIELLTGRTHQIRVQLEYLGHPVVGDTLYGSKKSSIRQFVHANMLGISLPNGSHKIFQAPLPDDLAQYLATLKHE